MPTKWVIVIGGLAIIGITASLLLIGIVHKNTQPPTATTNQVTLAFSPVTGSLARGQFGTQDIIIDSHGEQVSAVQLALSYNPNVLDEVTLKSPATNSFFGKPQSYSLLPISSGVNTVRFAISILANGQQHSGTGVIATLRYHVKPTAQPGKTVIRFVSGSSGSIVTMLGKNESILGSATSLPITIQ